MTQYIDPMLLGITPPMDLEFPDPGYISEFPMKLRIYNSIGLFGTRRDVRLGSRRMTDGDLIRLHEGVDLLAPVKTKVFAVQSGTVVEVNSKKTALTIEHSNGFRYLTFYQHLQNIRKRKGDFVKQGERIAEVGVWNEDDKQNNHLHFELRYPFGDTSQKRVNSLAVDPTAALYEWEKKQYKNTRGTRDDLLPNIISSFSEVVMGRLLRFLKIKIKGYPNEIYFPLNQLNDTDRMLVETLRMAFFNRYKIEVDARDSLFFNQIIENVDSDNKILILADFKVLG